MSTQNDHTSISLGPSVCHGVRRIIFLDAFYLCRHRRSFGLIVLPQMMNHHPVYSISKASFEFSNHHFASLRSLGRNSEYPVSIMSVGYLCSDHPTQGIWERVSMKRYPGVLNRSIWRLTLGQAVFDNRCVGWSPPGFVCSTHCFLADRSPWRLCHECSWQTTLGRDSHSQTVARSFSYVFKERFMAFAARGYGKHGSSVEQKYCAAKRATKTSHENRAHVERLVHHYLADHLRQSLFQYI